MYPNPTNRGDKLRWHALLTSLATLAKLEAIFGFAPGRDVRSAAFERLFCSVKIVPANVLQFVSAGLALELAGRPSVFGRLATPGWRSGVFSAASSGSPVLLLGPSASAIPDLPFPAVLDLIDVSSRVRTPSGDRLTKDTVLSAELEMSRRFVVILACEDDRKWLIRHGGDERRLVAIPNGVDPQLFEAARHPSRGVLLFVGNFNFQPNREALTWFLEHCWPVLQADRSGLSLRVVGYGADRIRERPPAVEIFANAPDMLPHYQESEVAIAPLQSASGVQNKVIEAMAAGLPVVCTSPVSRGLSDGHPAVVADDRDGFIDACRALTSDAARREDLGAKGREYARRSHNWNTSANDLYNVLVNVK